MRFFSRPEWQAAAQRSARLRAYIWQTYGAGLDSALGAELGIDLDLPETDARVPDPIVVPVLSKPEPPAFIWPEPQITRRQATARPTPPRPARPARPATLAPTPTTPSYSTMADAVLGRPTGQPTAPIMADAQRRVAHDVAGALLNLGFKKRAIEDAFNASPMEPTDTFETAFRRIMRRLTGHA